MLLTNLPQKRKRLGMKARSISCYVIACLYLAAGVMHLVLPAPFVAIVPNWVPAPALMVMLTGLAEILGAIGIAQRRIASLRKAAAWGLAVYAACVWPANFQHMAIDLAKPDRDYMLAYHIPRLMLQPVLIWWPLWAAGLIRWPLRSTH